MRRSRRSLRSWSRHRRPSNEAGLSAHGPSRTSLATSRNPARSVRLRLQPVGVQRTENGTVHLMTHFMTTGNQYSFASANSTQNLPTRSNSATKVRPSPQSAQIASWIPFEGLLLRPRLPFHSSLYPVAAPRFRCYAVVVIRYAELKSAGWKSDAQQLHWTNGRSPSRVRHSPTTDPGILRHVAIRRNDRQTSSQCELA